MAKTTFLQRILQRPSQTYYEPAPKRYHSVKSDLLQQAGGLEVETRAEASVRTLLHVCGVFTDPTFRSASMT